jgi:hypothetical protein
MAVRPMPNLQSEFRGVYRIWHSFPLHFGKDPEILTVCPWVLGDRRRLCGSSINSFEVLSQSRCPGPEKWVENWGNPIFVTTIVHKLLPSKRTADKTHDIMTVINIDFEAQVKNK